MPKPAKWGRTETIIWPPRSPIYTYGAIFLACIAAGLFMYLRFNFALTPLQQFYLPYYLRTEVAGLMHKTDKYQLLVVADARGRLRLAGDSDVQAGKTIVPGGRPLALELTPAARDAGAEILYRAAHTVYGNPALHEYLRHDIYAGREPFTIFRLPLLFGLVALGTQLPFSIPRDIRRRKEMKYGRRLRGPVLLSPKEFNRTLQGDGIGIKVDGLQEMLRVPARAESQHIQIIGDSGAGKTTIIFQVLRQIQGRGDAAIIYDPACEFIQRFYDPKRGDVILNPLDARCPYWGPSEELRRKSEAKSIAESLFQPTQDRKGEFFIETPQKIFAHLLTYGPSPQDLVQWMSNDEEIDRRVMGTEMAYMIAKGAQEQRNGVLASLGLVADSLRMVPTRAEAKAVWTATEWAEERKGWIFITSQPAQRAALRPLHSLWIDLLVMRLLNEPKPEQKRVWFVLDELASLQRLPQLHTAITENRKSRNPLVLGFQGKAQLKYIYGHLAEVMLSQPATNIWLKTKEPKAGQWVSEFIGKVEIERMRETHFDGSRSGRNFALDRQEEPLVMESEISGLEDLHAFLKHANFVTRFSFPYLDVPSTRPSLSRASFPAKSWTSTQRRCGNWMRRSQPVSRPRSRRRHRIKSAALKLRRQRTDMLTISKPLNASQARNYHAIEFTSPDQSYWSRGQTVRGEWHGRLTEKFGLSGAVGAEEFERLAQGQDPATGDQLVQHRQVHEYHNTAGEMVKSVEHRAGWDATFAAPKSVSLTALVGGDNRVRLAHREAVTTALTELERYTQARIGGNHPAETTGQFVAAKFEHDTARPVNGYAAPQLHTHSVIFNMTERADGSPRAVQPRSLFESQQFATAVYQSELMYRLRNLGYEITAGRSGAPEIKGYTQEYLDASSPRSQQIREYMERRGFQGYESAEIAAHSTRDAKKILSPAEVYAAHRQLAADFGNQADQVVAAARARLLAVSEPHHPEQVEMRAREAVTWARDKVFEREAVGDERGILREALRRGMGELRHPEIRANFEGRRNSGEFQEIAGPKHNSGRLFTTREVLGAECDVIRIMRDGQGQAAQTMPIQQAIAHTETYSHPNSGQRRAVEEILVSRDRVQGLQGFAGVGKSAALTSVHDGAERNGYAVEGFAPTSCAARQLRDAGIPSDTLQGFLARGQQAGTDPNSRHLYMVDEASLAGTRQMREFLTRIGPQDRVLLIGDTRQHQGIEAGKPFEQLVEAGMRTAQLDQIMRQKDPELKAAVERLALGDMAGGINMLERQGRVKEITDPAARIQAIARDYAANPDKTLIVSPDNASRREINDAVRHELQARGVVNVQDHSLRILVPRQELTGAERQWASRYEPGDVLRYTRGSSEHGIERGSYARVVTVNPADNLLSIEKQNGELATYDPKRLRGVSVYRETEREFAMGDRIQFTAPDKQLQVANRDLATIEAISPPGEISARLDNGRTVTFSSRDNPHLDHGYAVTSHSSQGLTADYVLVNVDTSVNHALINRRFAYVSVSRASIDARIYTNHAASLGKDLSHDVSKSAAMEVSQSLGQATAAWSHGIRL